MMHCFDIDIAQQYGINCAVLLENLRYWIAKNKANNKNFHDGHYWTYNTVKAFAELFPYISARQISTALNKLQDDGLIITGNYNEEKYDRTTWYAITEKGFALLEKRDYNETAESEVTEGSSETCESEGANMSNACCKNVKCNMQKCEMHYANLSNALCENVEPIPDINTNINTDINAEEESTAPAPAHEEQSFKEKYNAICKSFPRAVELTPKRAGKVRALIGFLNGQGIPQENFLSMVENSKFLHGKPFASFDWLIEKSNAVKVIEGKYISLCKPSISPVSSQPSSASYDLEQFKREAAFAPLIYSKKKRGA